MARFRFPPRFGMRVRNDGNTLAFFNFVDTETMLEFKDWKLMNGSNGMFVSAPTGKPYVNGEGKKIFPPYVAVAFEGKTRSPKGDQWIKELTEAAVAEYNQTNGSDAPVTSPRKSGSGVFEPSGGKKATYDASFGAEDDDLPF